MKTEKEINEELENPKENTFFTSRKVVFDGASYSQGFKDALKWVLKPFGEFPDEVNENMGGELI